MRNAGVFRRQKSVMRTVDSWSWDQAEQDLTAQHPELYAVLAGAAGKISDQRRAAPLRPLDGISFGKNAASLATIGRTVVSCLVCFSWISTCSVRVVWCGVM